MARDKIVLKGGYIPSKIEDVEQFLQERVRGCGRHKSGKDYKRRPKYRKSEEWR